MAFFKEELQQIRAMLFDVDGVLSCDVSPLDSNGDPVRTANVKDGMAIRMALDRGFQIGVITGGMLPSVKLRHQKLGIIHYYDGVRDKVASLEDFIQKTGIEAPEILFMGDDLVDFAIMQLVGIAACPSDAVPEIKAISQYVSHYAGGRGCVRDIIEQVMRAQNVWFSELNSSKRAF